MEARAMKKLALLFLLAAPLAAQPWSVYQKTLQQPVEQQTPGGMSQPDRSKWVINPTTFFWDADDFLRAVYLGGLAPGESVAYQDGLIADWVEHLVYIEGCAESRTDFQLSILLSNASGAAVALLSAAKPVAVDKRTVCARACFTSPDFDITNDELQPVIGSGGGLGKAYGLTWEVTNTGPRRIKNLSVIASVRLLGNASVNQGCPHGWSGWESARVCVGNGFEPNGRICWDK